MGYADQLLSGREKRRMVYLTPEDFIEAAAEYFRWCEDNPIQEEQVWQYQGLIVRGDLAKCRAFTKTGLATHLGIPYSRLSYYRDRDDPAWGEAVDLIEQVIYTQKFEQAAAGQLNSSMITRDLGLADKVDNTSSDGTMTPKDDGPTIIEFVYPNVKPKAEIPDATDTDRGTSEDIG